MTDRRIQTIVTDWIATARASAFQATLHRAVYQPMLELLAYLRANGFKTFIVSGGGIEFMRPWTEQVYGVPPEQVVGIIDQDAVPNEGRHTEPVSPA